MVSLQILTESACYYFNELYQLRSDYPITSTDSGRLSADDLTASTDSSRLSADDLTASTDNGRLSADDFTASMDSGRLSVLSLFPAPMLLPRVNLCHVCYTCRLAGALLRRFSDGLTWGPPAMETVSHLELYCQLEMAKLKLPKRTSLKIAAKAWELRPTPISAIPCPTIGDVGRSTRQFSRRRQMLLIW